MYFWKKNIKIKHGIILVHIIQTFEMEEEERGKYRREYIGF
jgi:hypothetical protein